MSNLDKLLGTLATYPPFEDWYLEEEDWLRPLTEKEMEDMKIEFRSLCKFEEDYWKDQLDLTDQLYLTDGDYSKWLERKTIINKKLWQYDSI